MERRGQTVMALGVGAIELSVICMGMMALIAYTHPHQGAVIAIVASLYCAAVCFAYRWYAKHVGQDANRLAVVAMRAWLIMSLVWLPATIGWS